MNTTDFATRRAELQGDPGVRDWVKQAIASLEQRDICDVLSDLELLGELFGLRHEEAVRLLGGQAGIAPAEDLDPAVVRQIRCRDAELACPHCGALQEAWVLDPRGRDDICEVCQKPYRVAGDALVTIS